MRDGTNHTIVEPIRYIRGCIQVPGDKSISHRAGIISAIAGGESVIQGFLRAEDTLNTLSALSALGAVVRDNGTSIFIKGEGGGLRKPKDHINCGNSATGMRLLAGLLSGQPFDSVLTGDESLQSRPMARIKTPLEEMGARVELTGDKGCAPIRIKGGGLRAIDYLMPVASAQVKSCILLAGLFAEGITSAIEPMPCRDHTERMLRKAGADITVDGGRVSVKNLEVSPLAACKWIVPGDFSSAAFWICVASCVKKSELVIRNLGLNSRRTALLDVLRRMGANIEVLELADEDEPYGTIRIVGAELHCCDIGGAEIPNLIDEIPILSVVAACATGATKITGASELRIKESDRIKAVVSGLRSVGVDVEELPDGMVVKGPAVLKGGATVESVGDHRIAMSMAILGLMCKEPVRINDTTCVAISYPEFWTTLKEISVSL